MPKRGRGEFLKIAKHLGIHTSTLSQVLSGTKQFTLDQACSLADYFGLNELETQYLFHLVELERAGTERLRATLKRQLAQLKEQSKNLSAVVPGKRTLSEEEKATFYSNWYYAGIWALTSIEGYQTADAIVKYFGLPKLLINRVIMFLLKTGLCIEEKGLLRPGTTYVHLENDSPFIGRHHSSWRQKAMERHTMLSETEIAYSSPMSLSNEDAAKIRKLVIEWVEQANKIRDPSPCETLFFLNIDWIKF
jgi:plasmid maintenance system antidote protein VapI